MRHSSIYWFAAILSILGVPVSGLPADVDELKVKRQEAFEFSEKPAIARDGDHVTVRFAVKAYCDATVAIEDAGGRTIRHLASGVLGGNAPQPFQKDSLKQALVWDCKNDRGDYVTGVDKHRIRVSLGLTAQYERNLMWCPKKRGPTIGSGLGPNPALLAPSPEGVYVFDGEFAGEHVRLFDHDGNYVRTAYPFPAGQLKNVAGLKARAAAGPDGGPVPLKWNQELLTMLTASHSQYGGDWPVHLGPHASGLRPTAITVRDKRIALAAWRLNRLGADGSSGGGELSGPGLTFPAKLRALHEFPGGVFDISPRSAAIDAKGEWLYLSGYAWCMPWNQDGLHGVVRLRLDGKEPPQAFAGTMEQNKDGQGDNQLSLPLGVTCDSAGRVYVCDYMNDRIQVFSDAGKLIKSIRTWKPAYLDIHPKTGELFVFSWLVGNERMVRQIVERDKQHLAMEPIPPTLTRYAAIDFGAADKAVTPRQIAAYAVPLDGIPPATKPWMGGIRLGLLTRAAMDFGGAEPTVWISEGSRDQITWKGNIRIFAMKDGKLELIRDFAKDVEKDDPQPRTPYHGRQRLYFNHGNGRLYVGEQFYDVIHVKSFGQLIELDPARARGKVIDLPFDCEDMAFDMDGRAYLRTMTQIARYDPTSWREVPFDYGQEQERVSYTGARGGRTAKTVNSLAECRLEGNSSGQFYGMCVSPKGYVVITGCHRSPAEARTDEKNAANTGVERYEPQIYPGRPWGSLVHVFDERGKVVYEDALPGSHYFQGIGMDKDDNLYVQHSGMPPAAGGKYPADVHRNACTLIKLKPKSRFISPSGGIVPLPPNACPTRPFDFLRQGGEPVWIEKADWMYGGIGLSTKASPGGNCHCFGNSRFAFDFFARSFVAELDLYRLAVLDTNGNVILRIGRYGNADDGKPLAESNANSPAARPIGGDEVSLMQPLYLATQTDQRLFVADIGNYRILSVKLDYHATERVSLKEK